MHRESIETELIQTEDALIQLDNAISYMELAMEMPTDDNGVGNDILDRMYEFRAHLSSVVAGLEQQMADHEDDILQEVD